MTRTVTTTTAEDEAITHSYQQSQKGLAGVPPIVETEAQYFERMVHNSTLGPMVFMHTQTKNADLVVSLSSIPEANRPAAKADIDAVIVTHGGTVPATAFTYLWSSNTAAPPRVNSVELDATEANHSTVTKLTFDDMDSTNVSRMNSLLGIKINTLIRLEDAASVANFVQVLTTGTPIQRQGADGFVELPVKIHSKGGSFAALDTLPLKCTFI